jgi:uncharacterized cupredoxin-like copper-binding protein
MSMAMVVFLLVVGAGCGDDDDDDNGDDTTGTTATAGGASPAVGGATTVNVTLTEYRIEMPDELAAGTVTFTIANNGSEAHNFEIEGQGVEEKLENNLEPGQTATLEVTLEPGEYEIYCPVEGHDELGMRKDVEVK